MVVSVVVLVFEFLGVKSLKLGCPPHVLARIRVGLKEARMKHTVWNPMGGPWFGANVVVCMARGKITVVCTGHALASPLVDGTVVIYEICNR